MANERGDRALEAIEIAKNTGKIKRGANEVTKMIERGEAKLVVIAEDVSPAEVVMHIPLIAKEKGIICIKAGTKEELGTAAGMQVGTTAVAIVKEGDAKNIISELGNE